MLRITRETDYGIVLLTWIVRDANPPYSAATLAKQQQLPLPMASKVLKALVRAGLLVSQRGAQGGYSLARSPEDISAADIIDALEGPIAITECSSETSHTCLHEHHCGVSSHWNRINQAIRAALKNISLLEMSQPPATPIGLPLPGRIRAAVSSDRC